MSRDEVEGAAPAEPVPKLALACVAVWVTAAATTAYVGIWPAIGVTAVVLGIVVLMVEGAVSPHTLRPSVQLVLVGATSGAVMVAATYVVYPVLIQLVPFISDDIGRLYAEFREPPLAVVLLALGPVILGEELVWRSVVQGEALKRAGTWKGVGLAAGIYALVHAPVGLPALVVVALTCGLCWGALRVMTGSLVPTLVAHVVWDIFVLLWLPLDAR